ncbi:type VI secretion system protein ImpF [Arboricoccus pini]|uniref:Type VI secretion system protein ImpF n=1 Tax=Arboricoccus pini TaxID=1963835 RepID=A0A212RQD6_9PROT|nr:type VI secretion system baseplate subunit TssE [Arboricoccus pini]SNB74783.1 type VI secretion system protein ImpF [Arboricoccus pini]
MRARAQPSLLDRLTDHRPAELKDSEAGRSASLSALQAAIRRDLAWLLNTTRLQESSDLTAFPHVMASTLNYGVPALGGQVVEGVDRERLRLEISLALRLFEPRLLAGTVRVTPLADDVGGPLRALNFRIEAELFAHPAPLRIIMRTEFDLESGDIRIAGMRSDKH